MVLVSARFIPDIHRPDFSFDSTWQTVALWLAIAGTACLAAALVWLRADLLGAELRLEDQLHSYGR